MLIFQSVLNHHHSTNSMMVEDRTKIKYFEKSEYFTVLICFPRWLTYRGVRMAATDPKPISEGTPSMVNWILGNSNLNCSSLSSSIAAQNWAYLQIALFSILYMLPYIKADVCIATVLHHQIHITEETRNVVFCSSSSLAVSTVLYSIHSWKFPLRCAA